MSFEQGIMTEAIKQIFSDSKRTVSLERATRSVSNITGTEKLTYATATNVELIFFKTDRRYEFGLEGLIEKGDCLIFDKPNNVNLARDDKITVDGETFIVRNVIAWRSRGEHIYDAATGFRL